MTNERGDEGESAASVNPRPDSVQPGVDGASTAPRGRLRRQRQRAQKPALPVWQETLLLVGMALVLAIIIKTFLLQAFYIPSGSMRDTLKVDDRILVQKMSYWFGDVERGDTVVFDDPAHWLGDETTGQGPSNVVTKSLAVIGLYPAGGHLVKRVIGVGGDTVECVRGSVEVNGERLDESAYVTLSPQACQGDWTVMVPDDHLWVLGDNRSNSADSRAHMGDPGGGFIPSDDVVGKVFAVVWPPENWTFIGRPGIFDDARLDQAAGFATLSAPGGLALMSIPLLRRRRRPQNRKPRK